MKCQRCGNRIWRFVLITGPGILCESWTCCICGECIDQIILHNRTGIPRWRFRWEELPQVIEDRRRRLQIFSVYHDEICEPW